MISATAPRTVSARIRHLYLAIAFGLVIGMIPIGFGVDTALAATTSFQEGVNGYSATIDTWVSDAVPSQDNSTLDAIDTDLSPIEQGLIRFDGIIGTGPNQIPPGATVTSASLTIVNNNPAGSGVTLSLHRMLTAWSETDTWNTLGGGIQTDDVEASATADVVYAGAELTVIDSTSVISGLEAAVQSWVDGSPNHGWALILGGTTDGLDLRSSDHPTQSLRPLLSVTYTAASSNVLTVNSTGDASDNNPGDDVCDTGGTVGSDPECTLRAAIQEANASATIDTIDFAIPVTDSGHVSGVWTITPGTAYDPISALTMIDGTTQTGWTSDPIIEIDGVSTTSATGLTLSGTSDGSMVTGLRIVGFDVDGVFIALGADSITISNSWIGSDGTGSTVPGNGDDGIEINGTSAVIDGNVVNHNTDEGIDVRAAGATITGNIVGLEADGTSGSGNGDVGIAVFSDNTTIGGPSASERNVISLNVEGIELNSSNNVVQGNYIGTDAAGTAPRGNNSDDGVEIQSGSGNLIGGTGAGEANIIAFNQLDGVNITGGTGNSVLGNSIYSNGQQGIDLAPGGVTANDAGDGDSGPNDLLNFPVITSATESGGTVTVTFDLDVPANPDQYRVEFFSNPSGADGTGYGEGETFLAATTTGPGTGLTHAFSGSGGDVITATATRIDTAAGTGFTSTSEFSAAYTVTGALAPVVFDNIQSGTATVADGSSSTTATITAVDPTKAFLTFTVRGSDNSPDDLVVAGELTNATTVTFAREGTGGDVTIEWSVVEFVSGVTVQRGSTNLSSTTTNVPISTVDLSRTFVLMNGQAGGATFGASDFARAQLTSSTNLQINIEQSPNDPVKWQVVTYNEANVQRGTTSFAAGDSSKTATVAAVDTSKAWLVYTNTTAAGTANDIGQKLIRGQVTNGTTLTFDRSSTGQTLDVAWELVEFTDTTSVQHASVAFSSSESLQDVTITAVDPARSIAVGGATLFGGRSSFAGDDNPGVGWFTTTLTSSTNLRVRRDTAPSSADLGWFVVHWPGTPSTLTVNSTGDASDLTPGDDVCDTGGTVGAGPECTLRAAIEEANASATVDTIQFNIPTSDSGYSASPLSYTFTPASQYPFITDALVLDATTQPGYTGDPIIQLDGSGATGASGGLIIRADDSTIRGFIVHSFPDEGIEIDGSTLFGDNNVVANNWVGVDAGGNVLGNTDQGILVTVDALNNMIGGTGANDGNVVAGSGSNGILVRTNSTGNSLLGNSVFSNTLLGIDLDEDGVTASDAGDADTGSNDLLNYPVITSATESGGTVTVTFDLDVPGGTYRVEFFNNTAADASGYGEGETFLGSVDVSAGTGITHVVTGSAGDIFTATATESLGGGNYGSTSEFSATHTVTPATAPTARPDPEGATGSDRYSTAATSLGPVSYWRLGESSGPSAVDEMGSNNGTYVGPTLGVTGALAGDADTAANFDGANDYVDVGTFDLVGSGVTLTGWINADTFAVTDGRIISKATNTQEADHTWMLSTVSDSGVIRLRARIKAGGSTDTLHATSGALSTGQWHFAVLTYDESQIKLFLDGVEVGSASHSVGGAVDVEPLVPVWIGGNSPDATVKPFDGRIDEVAVFDRALTVDEIRRLHAAGRQYYTITQGSSLSTSVLDGVLANDTDPGGDALTASIVSGPSNAASFTLSADGSFDYTPDPAFSGTDSFVYSACDAGPDCDSATATITIDPVGSFTVNSTGDAPDQTSGDGLCDTGFNNSQGDPQCTLRAAIQEANAFGGADTITFAMPASESGHSGGVWTIAPGSEYPTITEAVTLDATTQTGYVSTPVVELNGTGAGGGSDGLRVFSPNVEIRGFAINRFPADGIEVDTTSTGGVVIAGNHLGLDPTGLVDRGNGGKGIDLQTGSGPTTVGGTTAADRNVVSGNGLEGIIVWGSDGNTIIGNYIGTDVTGNAPIANTNDGLHIGGGADNNIFGQPGAGNVISGNGNDALEIDDVSGGNIIQANTIGLGADGNTVVANGRYGVVLYNGANTTQIGGSGAGEGNVISANGSHGVALDGNSNAATTGNLIAGNLIGTDSTGLLDRGNGGAGIYLFAGVNNTTVGGSTAGHRNVISGNTTDGIYLQDAGTTGTVIVGNYIGVDITGNAALPNGDRGVQIESGANNTIVGGTAAGEGNVISANGNDGIIISDGASPGTGTTGTVIEGNLIGVGADGTTALGNGTNGVRVTTENGHRIGGTTAGAGNTIAHNGGRGVDIQNATASSNPILGNSIYANTNIGIDLGDDGVTANDSGDGDSGANGLLNYPVITSATESGGTVTVDFDLDVPAGNYRVEFFTNPSGADGSGFGEGESFVSSVVVTAGTGLSHSFSGVPGDVITASATHDLGGGSFGNTSEFSQAFTVISGAPVANNDSATTDEDTAVVIDVVANDTDPNGDTLLVDTLGSASNGSVVDNGDGTVTYTPSANFNGSDSFTYTATDGTNTSNTATVTLTVTPVNDAPVANDDAATTNEDTAVIIDLLANDTDVEGDTLSFVSVSNGANGSVTDNGDGTVTYTPNANWNGTDSFVYSVTDGTDNSNVATVTVTVNPVDDPPVAVGDSATTAEDTAVVIDLVANDTDPDGDSLLVGSIVQPTNGTVVDNGDGTVTYTPDADYNGTESFSYTATDGTNASNSATAWVTVTPVNDAPVAVDDSASTAEDTAVIVSVLANDTDVDGDTLSIDSFTQPTNGSVTDNGDGTLTYTPAANYSGSDSFTYVATDGTATSNTATVTMTVNAVNDAPVASDDSVSTSEDTAVVIAPLTNDADPEGDPLSIDSFTQPANGTVTDNGDGTVTYTPDADYFGSDSFTYVATDGTDTSNTATVTVTVTSVNDAPVAVDDSATTPEDTAVVIDLLGNDTDPEGDSLSIQGIAQPSNGTVTDNGDGTVTYTPDPDFTGSDPFTYSITDGTDPSNVATVSVSVSPLNDPPVAVDDAVTTPEDTAVIVSVLTNDTDVDGDTLSIDSFTQPANGTVTDNGDGTVTYTPNADYFGSDSFTYVAFDGTATSNTATVTVTVTSVNDAPVAVDDTATTNEDTAVVINLVANDTDVEGDGLVVDTFGQGSNGTVVDNGDGTVTYTPDADFNGADSFTYSATDGTDSSNTATVSVTVNPVNDAPVAADDSASTPEDTALVIAPLANDSDLEGDSLTIDSFTQPANGSVTDNGDGTLTYMPDPDFNGSDSFTYVATDGTSPSNTATVNVTVTPVNDPPMANDDTGFTSEDTAVTIDLTANDVDADGDALTFAGLSNGANGSVVDNGDGTVTYTPNADFNGTDTFTYSLNDGTVNSNAATVTVTVTAVNDAPVAVGDTATTNEDTAAVVDVVANDTDADGDALLVDAFTQGTSGTVADNGDGTVTYTPNADFNGLDTFTYSATDGTDPSNTVTVVVTVNAVNDAPVANDDSATTDEDTAVVIDLLANDTDLEGDAISIVSASNGANGSVTDNGDGTVTYTPNADFNGSDSFVYSVTDGTDNSNIATVAVTVNPLADAPVAVDDSASTPEDTAVVIDLVANDTDADGDALLVDTLSGASSGSVTDNGDGTVTYTPVADFVGTATFTYSATDGSLTSNTATVTVTVTAVNDAPVAVDDAASTPEDVAVVIGVIGNDTDVDGDPLSIDAITQGTNGSVTDNGDGTVTYTPNPDFNGSDSFTYVVTDGSATSNTATVTVTVTSVGDAPVANTDTASTTEDTAVVIDVAGNDTDVDGDLDPTTTSVTVSPADGTAVPGPFPGSVTYTPDPDFNGADSFTYEICDATALCDTAVVSVTVTAVNDAPVAADDSVSTLEDTAVVVSVLSNDSDVDGDPLSVGSFGQGANGTVTDNGDGTVTYTPDLNFNGTDSFTYTASDGTVTSNSATVTVTVGVVNDAPVAADDVATTPEDTAVTIDVVGNDTDLDGDPLVVATVGAAANGSVVDNGDGTVTYTPNADFNGTDSFTYTVTDGTDTSNTAAVTVTVTAVNDAPVAAGETATTGEDTAVTIGLLGNDSDVDGDPLSVASVGAAANGTVTDNGDGTVTYTPNADFNGIDSFTYTATDGTATSNTATVTVTVTAVNDAPVAADDTTTTAEDTSVIVAVLGNDSDFDGDPLSVASVGAAANGTVTDNGDGTVTYTPNADFNGTDSFTYTATDGIDTSNTAAVTVTVNAANDTPVAADDSAVTDEDIAVTFDFLGNDIDADADPLTVDSLSPAASGTVVDNGDGTFTYTPNSNFNGSDSFTYTVTDGTATSNMATVSLTVNAVNDAPIAIDDTAATSSDRTINVDVLANDIDFDGDPLSVVGVSAGTGGSVTDNGDGTIRFNPTSSFSGDATFTYTISDGALTDTGLVTVAVASANNPPIVFDVVGSIRETTSSGDPIGNVVATDPDGDGMVYVVSGDARLRINGSGQLTLVGVVSAGDLLLGTVTVTDANGASATGSIAITVTAVNSAPVISDQSFAVDSDAGLGSGVGTISATDPDGDPLTYTAIGSGPFTVDQAGRIIVAADLDSYSGESVTFAVIVTDSDGLSSGATVTVTVRSVTPTNTTAAPSTTAPPTDPTTIENRPPVATDDIVIGSEDTPKRFSPLSNDIDPDGDPLTLTWIQRPVEADIRQSSGYLFVPAPDWSGTTTAQYRIDDGRGGSDIGTVTFVINPVNDAPRIQTSIEPATVSSGGTVEIPIPTIIDPESDGYTISLGDPKHGTAEIVDGKIVYTPDPGYEGQDTIQLYVVDTAGAGSRGIIVIEVVVDGSTISVKILDLGEIGSKPEDGGGGVLAAGPGSGGGGGEQFVLFGIPFFGLIASEVLSATWAVRAPLIAFVVVAAVTLLATTRRSFSLAVKPLPVARASDLTWSVVLVGEFERLPALAGPDHSHKAVSFFDAGVTGIESTGKLMMTNGTLWVEVVTSAGPAWVEARHVTPGRPAPTDADRMSMIEVRDQLVDLIRHGEPFTHLVSGRGLYMEMSDEIAAVPQSRVDPLLTHILRDGDAESKQLIDALSMPLVKGDGYEVPIELRNFEYLIVGEGWNRWALYFERGADKRPVLVGVSTAKALVTA